MSLVIGVTKRGAGLNLEIYDVRVATRPVGVQDDMLILLKGF